MRKITGFKRALSVLLTLALMFSTVAVFGVSAEVIGTEYHFTFDASDGYDYANSYYVNQTPTETYNNCNDASEGASTKLVAGGYNGSAYRMEMAYTANGQTRDKQNYPSFSLPNNTGSNRNGRNHGQTLHLETNGTFLITVTYKVTGYVSPAALYYAIGMGALSDNDFKGLSEYSPTKIVDITGTTDWATASVIVTPATKDGAYIVLKMANDANRSGTKVEIGAVDIVPQDQASLSVVKFDSKGGSGVGDLSGTAGETIVYPADPVRAGYAFLGWFTEDGQPAPTVFAAGTVTLVAKWQETDTPPVPTGTQYTYTFNSGEYDYDGKYYINQTAAHTYNNTNAAGVATGLVAGGYNGSSHAMKMAYTQNGSTLDQQHYTAFSVPNNTGANKNGRNPGQSVHLEEGSTFRIRVTYKVTGYAGPVALYAGVGGYALSDMLPKFSEMNAGKIADITGTTDDWTTAVANYTPSKKNTLYFLLKAENDGQRAGTEVQIGKIEIIPIAATTLSFDSDGGSYVPALTGEYGTTITYPANPTREGYEFIKWVKEDGGDAPEKFPGRNMTLTALWLDLTVWSFENEAKDTELSLNAASGFSAKVTDAVKYTGSRSLKISSNNKTGVGRPQFFVKTASGERVRLEKDKNYIVSFRMMVPSSASIREFHYWINSTNRTAAYAASDNEVRKQEKFVEVNSIKIADNGGFDQWFEIKETVRGNQLDGYAMMGITGDSTAAHSFYIDDLKIYEEPYVTPEAGVWSFENEENDKLLSLNPRIPETTIRTDNTFAHAGYASARVNSDTSAGDKRPQMTVKDADGNTVMIEQGKNYIITYYVMIPQGEGDYNLNYWFTASPDETCYQYGTYSKNLHLLVEGKVSPAEKGAWKKVTAVVEKSSHSGMLRLGICADNLSEGNNVTFYIDDIKVEPIGTLDSVVQSFEDYDDGEKLALNDSDKVNITASDAIPGNTGAMVAEVTSNTNAGNPRPQMLLKSGLGQQLMVYKGRSYEVKFYLLVPEGQPDYEISWWLTATNDEVCFNNNGPKKDDFVVAQDNDNTIVPEKGSWMEVVLPIDACRYSGKLRLGITGTTTAQHTFYIDDISIYEVKADPESGVNSFERGYEDGEDVSLDGSIVLSGEDSRSGIVSAKVTTSGNDINAAPQMVLDNYRAEQISLEKGKKYRITFWVVVPKGESAYDIQYWLAATDSDAAFTTARENLVADTKTMTVAAQNTWQYVSVDIKNCPYAGKLRLGITGSTDEVHTFYIDDIKVEERLSAEPDPDAMNFENIDEGTNLALNGNENTIIVTTDESYTGDKSVRFHSVTNGGDNRPQMMVKDADGNQIKLEKGESYYLSFMMMVPPSEDYFNFSYWFAVVPDDKVDVPFVRESELLKNDYVLPGERSGDEPPTAGVWKEFKIAIMDCPKSGNLRVGLTHYNGDPFQSNFYIDDIKVSLPEYVLVKFDTNGSEDKYDDILMMSEMRVPFDGVDPYREGYEFMGWYTDKSFKKEFYFDLANDLMIGKTGDVVTLYACWKKWDEVIASGKHEDEVKYKVEYYEDKVWVGDRNVPDPWDLGDKLTFNDADPIVTTPDAPPQTDDGGMPPWLIVVIIVGAVVVVGGGAVLAAVLLKKNKKA